ncbi:hypothetical protein TVAG_028640 [Trichomonas vaginalis G3]|uniref:Uncharacterized protein n=1 Tax=Trichomonas vaginalis (strain ATCC PRA-98 / G3) TaxID=412133 RepID=A2E0B1_TRIV3|nr:hypothetical protein TVAGG3_0556740 [Trichomonas vaginalis G3]EAY13911.1 hypothetical protein TVAG_028640 [Trichomonas vaginalis G3]KAI5520905.1 hypothetical protein TVAGG3_0556740 [Trichomonas vaginalis G3]|eukprot:XP_001326134.1 hypothetical protein [Trichomonas vaginalis G3]
MNPDVQSLKMENEELKDTIDKQAKIILEYKDKIDLLTDGSYVPRENLVQAHDKVKLLEDENRDLMFKIQELQSKNESLNTKISTLEQQYDRQQFMTQAKEKEAAIKDERIDQHKKQIRDYEAFKVKVQQDQIVFISEKRELQDTVTRYSSHIEDIDRALKELMNANKDLSDALAQRNNVIQQLENRVSEDSAKIDLLQNELNEKNGHISDNSMRSKDQVSMKNTANIAQLQKQLIEARNKIAQLNASLEEVKKDAERAYALQSALESKTRELNLTKQKLDQRELELISDRDSRKELDMRINRYREQIEELVAQGNDQYLQFNQQVDFYKRNAVEESEEREKIQKKYEAKRQELSELKKEMAKYESKQYGLKEAASENRALKSMLSQRQAAIADYIFRIGIYERIIAALELELPSSFDFDKFAKTVFNDVDDQKATVADANAVKIMRKAISKQQNKDSSINIVVDHESTMQPPKDIIARPFSNQSMTRSQPLPPLDTGVTFPNENEKTLFSFSTKFTDKDTTLRMSSDDLSSPRSKRSKTYVLTSDVGIQFDGAAPHHESPDLSSLSENDDDQLRTLQRELKDVYARLDLYKSELDRARKQNEIYLQNISDLKQNKSSLDSYRTEQPLPSSSNRTETGTKSSSKTAETPDEFEQTPIKSLPPQRLSTLDQSNGENLTDNDLSQGSNNLGMMSVEVSETDTAVDNLSKEFLLPIKKRGKQRIVQTPLDTINEDDEQGRIPLQDTRRRISYDVPQINLKFDLPREVFQRRPHKTLASEICTMFKPENEITIEAMKWNVVSSFDSEIEEIDYPLHKYMQAKKADVVCAMKKDEYLIHKAQILNHAATVEKLQRKASTRKHKMSDLNDKLKNQEGIQQNLNNTIETLKTELANQRQEFQERLLQMRTETDRFLELQVGEMKRAQEFDNKEELRSEMKKSEELIEVSRLLTQLKNDKRQLEISLEESRETSRYMQRRNMELSDQVRKLESQNEEMKSKTEQPSPNTDFQKYAKKLKERLKNLEEKHKTLEKENEELKRKKSTRMDIYGVELVEKPVDELKSPRRSMSSTGDLQEEKQDSVKVRKMQIQMEEMTIKNGELQVLLARAQENIKKLQKLLSQKEETLAQKQQQCALLKQQVLAKQKKIDDLIAK